MRHYALVVSLALMKNFIWHNLIRIIIGWSQKAPMNLCFLLYSP